MGKKWFFEKWELGFSSASAFIHWRRQNVDPGLYVNYPMLTKPE